MIGAGSVNFDLVRDKKGGKSGGCSLNEILPIFPVFICVLVGLGHEKLVETRFSDKEPKSSARMKLIHLVC